MAEEKEVPSRAVALRLPHEIADALEREADGIKLATYIRALLTRHVREQQAKAEREGRR
jgi:hypothetical protein